MQLTTHFETVLTNARCDTDVALVEWGELKLYVSQNPQFRGTHPLGIWQLISQDDSGRNDYQNILKVIHMTSVYPLSTACCERGFSTMKRIKSDWRTSLASDTLDNLMRISIMHEGDIDDYDPRPAVNRWWLSGQRQRRPNIQPYGPHQ